MGIIEEAQKIVSKKMLEILKKELPKKVLQTYYRMKRSKSKKPLIQYIEWFDRHVCFLLPEDKAELDKLILDIEKQIRSLED